jgi:hypothetical protein
MKLLTAPLPVLELDEVGTKITAKGREIRVS